MPEASFKEIPQFSLKSSLQVIDGTDSWSIRRSQLAELIKDVGEPRPSQ